METSIDFSEKALTICNKILKTSYQFDAYCVQLKDELVFCGVLNETDDYYAVNNNKDFKKKLKEHLASYLEQEIVFSKYGSKFDENREVVISDFDLWFKCKNEKMRRAYLDEKFSLPSKKQNKIVKQMSNVLTKLDKWLTRQRDNVINSMDLLNTPDFEFIRKEASAKKKQLQEEKDKLLKENLSKSADELKEEVIKKLFSGDNQEEEDLEITRKVDEEETDELEDIDDNLKTDSGYLKDEFVKDSDDEDDDDKTIELKNPEKLEDDDSGEEYVIHKSEELKKENVIENLDDEEDIIVKHSPLRKKFSNRNKLFTETGENQLEDLYETDPSQVEDLLEFIKINNDKIIFEPCYGNGAISNVFKNKGFQVIERDLKYPNENGETFDFLEAEFPSFDILVTNPPYHNKLKFLNRAIQSGKPFYLLLPLATLALKAIKKIIAETGLIVYYPERPTKFLRDGKWVKPEDVVWICGNILTCEVDKIIMFYM